ncbi:discoidin domain-containing protein, partial [Streptomyces sp. NPDC059956]
MSRALQQRSTHRDRHRPRWHRPLAGLAAVAAMAGLTGLVVPAATAAGTSISASATAAGAAEAAPVLVSTGKPATASSVEASGFEAGKAVDANAATRWASAEGVDPQWIRIDLGAAHTISRVKLNWEAAYGK